MISEGDHYCTNCGVIPKGVKIITVEDNDFCENCTENTNV